MTKALMFSFVVHVAILTAVLVYSNGKPASDREAIITIVLSGDLEQGGAGGSEKVADTNTSSHPRSAQGEWRFEGYKRSGAGHASLEPLCTLPVKPSPADERPMQKTILRAESYEPPHETSTAARSILAGSSASDVASEVGGTGVRGAGDAPHGDPSGVGGLTASEAGPGQGSGLGKGIGDGQSGYTKEQFVYIRDLVLKRLTYPPEAKKRGWEGVVLVCFVIRENGTVEQLRVMKSSGHEVLDEHAMKTIRSVRPYPRPPVKAELIIPIAFKLE
jgi:protein TonB